MKRTATTCVPDVPPDAATPAEHLSCVGNLYMEVDGSEEAAARAWAREAWGGSRRDRQTHVANLWMRRAELPQQQRRVVDRDTDDDRRERAAGVPCVFARDVRAPVGEALSQVKPTAEPLSLGGARDVPSVANEYGNDRIASTTYSVSRRAAACHPVVVRRGRAGQRAVPGSSRLQHPVSSTTYR